MSVDFPKRNDPERLLRYLDGELPAAVMEFVRKQRIRG